MNISTLLCTFADSEMDKDGCWWFLQVYFFGDLNIKLIKFLQIKYYDYSQFILCVYTVYLLYFYIMTLIVSLTFSAFSFVFAAIYTRKKVFFFIGFFMFTCACSTKYCIVSVLFIIKLLIVLHVQFYFYLFR